MRASACKATVTPRTSRRAPAGEPGRDRHSHGDRRGGAIPRRAEKICATTSELFALWRAIGETSGDPAIGVKLGLEPRFERFNPTAIDAVCSRTFRDALGRIARYKRLTCPEEIRVRTVRGEAHVEFAYPEASEDEPEVLVDLVLSWLHSIGSRGTDGRIRPVRVELARSARNRDIVEGHFGCRAQFRAERNALQFVVMTLLAVRAGLDRCRDVLVRRAAVA